jgi:hypothetical protein
MMAHENLTIRLKSTLSGFQATKWIAIWSTVVAVWLALTTFTFGQGAVPPKKVLQEAQQHLSALGYELGSADGVMGLKTIAALKKFQSNHGLPVTGALDQPTLNALRAARSSVPSAKPVGDSEPAEAQAGQMTHFDHPLHAGDTLPAMGGDNGIQIVGGTGAEEAYPAQEAAGSGDLEGLKALLKSNPRLVSSHGKMGMTPLHLAAWRGKKDVAELLLAKGSDVNALDHGSGTPLFYAAMEGHTDVAELLLARGARVNIKNSDGWAPLHYASQQGYIDVVELLLAKGADVNATTDNGWTPLRAAESQQRDNVAQLLRQHGGHE